MKTKFFIFIILLFFNFSLIGQINELGKPFLINYSTKVYQANEQNWATIQDKRGVMYFGNTDGVLEYDGNEWALIPVANN